MHTATRGSPRSVPPTSSATGAERPLLEASPGPSRWGVRSIDPSGAVAWLPSSSVAISSTHSVRGSSVGGTVTIVHQ